MTAASTVFDPLDVVATLPPPNDPMISVLIFISGVLVGLVLAAVMI